MNTVYFFIGITNDKLFVLPMKPFNKYYEEKISYTNTYRYYLHDI